MADVITCSKCSTKLRVPVTASGVPRCPNCRAYPPWLVEAVDLDFPAVTQTKVPVLVDLWAPWCGPCRTIAPALEQLASDMAGHLKVVKVNVDEAPRAAATFDARSIPTLVIIRDGKVVARQAGALPPQQLAEWIRRATTAQAA